jgi:hypothetical protein
MMKRAFKVALALMVTLTAVYAGLVVYADVNAGDGSGDIVVYGAFKCKSETPPTVWYTPEQLGIVGVRELDSYWLHVSVDLEREPFSVEAERPIFVYKGVFYQILEVWVTPALPKPVINQWQGVVAGTLGAGLALAGVLFFRAKQKG